MVDQFFSSYKWKIQCFLDQGDIHLWIQNFSEIPVPVRTMAFSNHSYLYSPHMIGSSSVLSPQSLSWSQILCMLIQLPFLHTSCSSVQLFGHGTHILPPLPIRVSVKSGHEHSTPPLGARWQISEQSPLLLSHGFSPISMEWGEERLRVREKEREKGWGER